MSLPSLPTERQWSSNLHTVAQILQDMYRTANLVLANGNFDVQRLRLQQETLIEDAIPLLLDTEKSAEDEELPESWLRSCVQKFGALLVQLCEAEHTATGG
jgi:hypothetical protein